MIVVFGSINLDLVIPVAALPRPGETVLAPGYEARPGGKGANQALAARRAGAEVAMFGCVGRDAFADTALEGLRDAGVELAGVMAVDAPTGLATVCVDAAGENQIAVASGANLRAGADRVPDDALGPSATVLLQLEVDAEANRSLIARAHARGARVVLNAAPAAPLAGETLAAVDVLVVNALEAAMLTEALALPAPDPVAGIRALAARIDGVAVITLGADGAAACAGDTLWRVPALPVEVVDTTGAGDAFTGVFAAALDADRALPEALRRASVAGALACTARGAQAALPTAAEIEARLRALPVAERG